VKTWAAFACCRIDTSGKLLWKRYVNNACHIHKDWEISLTSSTEIRFTQRAAPCIWLRRHFRTR
jgi:hypothetical protein